MILRNKQRAVAVAEEAETIGKSIIIYYPPITLHKSRHEQQKCTLWLMKIRHNCLYDIISVSGSDNYLRM